MDTHHVDALIIGGGLAGLTTAHTLSSHGKSVHVLEAKPYLGGRTASWEENGMRVESGLHRFLGFYTELPKLMEEVGIDLDKALVWEDEIEIRIPDGGPTAVYGMALLHKPIKSIKGLLGENYIVSPGEKVALAGFHIAGLADYATDPDKLDTLTVLDYALKHGVSERAIKNILVPFTEGIFFLPPEQYSALPFFGLLAQAAKRFRLGVATFTGGMTEVLIHPIAQAIRHRGGRVETNAPVEHLIYDDGKVVGVVRGGMEIRSREVVLATSLKPAQDILHRSKIVDGFEHMFALPTMPAVTIQMELEGPASPVDRTIFAPGTVLATFAEQSRTTFTHVPGRLSVILTPPERFLGRGESDILAQVIAEARRVDIDLRRQVTNYRIITHPHDFYSLTCGTEKLRPTQETRVPGLTLAGDYTKQEFFSTMEGAVRSGLKAATIVLEKLGTTP
jgi:15-cis-phytoene desaturase